MDLHSILNDSDSDDEQYIRGNPLEGLRHPVYSDGSGNVDLEQILRDDDDDDDDDDNGVDVYDDVRRYKQVGGNHVLVEDRSHGTSSQHFSTAHSAEDWALLQTLLDDNEETEGGDDGWMYATGGLSSNKNVDAILLSDNDDDESDDPAASRQLGAVAVTLAPIPSVAPTSTVTSTMMHEDGVFTKGDFGGLSRSISHHVIGMPSLKVTDATESPTESPELRLTSNMWTNGRAQHSFSKGSNGSSEADAKRTSEQALDYAQAYERKLLRSGHRDIVSPLMVKRRLKQKIEMTTRARHKSTSQSDRIGASTEPRFGFSGILETRTMKGVAAGFTLDNLRKKGIKKEVGLPTALAVNSKFIALGTQHGIILVFDLFEVLKQVLNAANCDDNWNSKQAGSITSIDLNMNDEVLVAGYTSGFIVLWDTIRGVVLRTVTDTHPSPITSVRFLSDLKLLSCDAGGLVNKLTFAKTMLWSTYSMEAECLLDGTAGQILAMSVQPPISTVNSQQLAESIRHQRRMVLVALSSERSSFAVAIEPSVNVLHRWPKPPVERIKSAYSLNGQENVLPCLAWGWALTSGGGNFVAPILARAWGCCVQLLLASFPSIEDDVSGSGGPSATGNGETVHWPSFGLISEFDVDDPIVALEWLNERSLAYLTMTSEFVVVDTVTLTLQDRVDFSNFQMVYAEFSLSRSSEQTDKHEDSSPAFCSTFQNSIRSSDRRLLVLCQEELKLISMVGAKKRIAALEEDGEWLEALAAALDHYENTVSSLEDRKRSLNGRTDFSKHPEFISATKNEADEWISKLLIRYLNLAVDNAPESPLDEHGMITLDGSHAIVDLAQSHFQMLAGVCVEFCLVTRRLDLLFGQIFRRFQNSGFPFAVPVFLDVLEPYILSDKLSYIAPEAMACFIDHYKATNGIATVERCLLHMDVRIMDFHAILALLKHNQMYSALFYVMNQGLDDYVTPLEFLMENLFEASDNPSSFLESRRSDGVPQNNFERLGYKAILYLQSCFRGKAFPKETDTPPDRLPSLRADLLSFLLRKAYTPSAFEKGKDVLGNRTLQYPYTRMLLNVDARAFMDSVCLALDAHNYNLFASDASSGPANGSSRAPNAQEMATMLSCILLPDERDKLTTLKPSRIAVNAYLDFLAKYLMEGGIRVEKSTTFRVLSRMAERFSVAKGGPDRVKEQRLILDLLTALPRSSYDASEVLRLVDKTGINRAALLLHQEGASWEGGQSDPAKRSSHFSKAIDCYIRDDDVLFRREVFQYVKKECAGTSSYSSAPSNSIRESLFSRIPDLVQLDPLMTAELVAELFVEDLARVVQLMDDADFGESQFKFFEAIIGGDLYDINPVAGSVLNAHLAMEHHHKYLSLMAQLHPDMVYAYLSTHDNYRADECLKLCQDHSIADASAYLLERMGHVASALQLILQTLESRMMGLKRTIRGIGLDDHLYLRPRCGRNSSVMVTFGSKQDKEVAAVKRLLVVALDLCDRNARAHASASDHGSQLWFNVLDRLINAKGFLRLSKEQEAHAMIMSNVLGELLRLAMQRMVSSVPLTDLVRKVTSDHSGSRLGELREMMESLLSTYGFELRVFSNAVNVYHHDVQNMHREQRNLKLEGTGVSKTMQRPSLENERCETDNITSAFMEKASQSGCPVVVSRGGSLSFAENNRLLNSRKNDSGLAEAVSRLRSRRKDTAGKRAPRSRHAGVSFVAPGDDDTMEDSSGIGPVVGQLGEAEHRGKLISYM
jgi:vacuolar protein sorting-associated protein 8